MDDTPKTDLVAGQSQEVQGKAMSPENVWNSLMQAALDPRIDAGKLTALVDLQRSLKADAAKEAYTKAKARAMHEMPTINKDNIIEHNGKFIARYNKYEDLRAVIDPILKKHNLRISHNDGYNEGSKMQTVQAVLTYVGPNDEIYVEYGGAMPIPLDGGGAKSGAQAAGSSQKYGKRLTTEAMLGIVSAGLDNDGQFLKGNGDPAAQKTKNQITQGVRVDTESALRIATAEAAHGLESYTAFFRSSQLSATQKGWLIDSGNHDKLKSIAEKAGA